MKATTLLTSLLGYGSLISALPAPVESLQATVKRSISGPVLSGANFPDPTVIEVGGVWYAFATRTKGSTIHIQAATSSDFENWSLVKNADGSQYDALPTLPPWVNQQSWNTWAPSITQISANSFVMYYAATAASSGSGMHCVGAATATNVQGPYIPQATSLFCPLSKGGAIDPAGFQDRDGKRYIVYKVDGNSLGHGGACGNSVTPISPTPLILQPVAADGVTLTGTATTLLQNNGVADEGIIEAPSLTVTRSGTYILAFSSGCFTDSSYTVSYATASKVTGPYTRNATPLFKTGTDGLQTPGSATLWSDTQHMVFHANYGTIPGYGTGRAMYTALITVNKGVLSAK